MGAINIIMLKSMKIIEAILKLTFFKWNYHTNYVVIYTEPESLNSKQKI